MSRKKHAKKQPPGKGLTVEARPLNDEEATGLALAEAEAFNEPVTCPFPADPAMGDKDPAVMEWYQEHAPEEYARRYANRITPHSGGVRHERIERGPVSDFEDETEAMKKPTVIMD